MLLTQAIDAISIWRDHDYRQKMMFIFECHKIVSKGTAQKRETKATLVGLQSPQCHLIESFVTSALDQMDEDARALRVLRAMQRRKSAGEVRCAGVAYRDHGAPADFPSGALPGGEGRGSFSSPRRPRCRQPAHVRPPRRPFQA